MTQHEHFEKEIGLCLQCHWDHEWKILNENKNHIPEQLECTKCGKVKTGPEFCTWLLIQDLKKQKAIIQTQIQNNPQKLALLQDKLDRLICISSREGGD